MARASRGCITAISRNSLLTGNLFLAYNNCEIMFGQGIPLPELIFYRSFIRTVEFESTVLFVNKKNQKTDAAAERHRTRSDGRGARRKAKPNFLRCFASPGPAGYPCLQQGLCYQNRGL